MFHLKSPNGLGGEVKNWFSGLLLQPLWISNRYDFYLFFIYTSICCYIASLNLIRLVVCEKMSKTEFQGGNCGGNIVFPIDTILTHFDPEVPLLLQSKFRLKSTKGLGRDVEN